MTDDTIRFSVRKWALIIFLIMMLFGSISLLLITQTVPFYFLLLGWTFVSFLVGYFFVLIFHRHPSHWMMFIATLGNMVLFKGLKIRRAVLYLLVILIVCWMFFYVYLEHTVGYLIMIFLFIYWLWLGYQLGTYIALKHIKIGD